MVTIWRVANPDTDDYATFRFAGEWVGEELCPACGVSRQVRARPIVIEWLPGSDVIADVTWAESLHDLLLVRAGGVGGWLAGTPGVELMPVEMVPGPPPKRRQRAVTLPYAGPELRDVVVADELPYHPDSTVETRLDCPVCGEHVVEVNGVERIDSHWDADAGVLRRERVPRRPGHGVRVAGEAIGERLLFRIVDMPRWLFCDDRFRDRALREGVTNVDFFEFGEVV